ncbi:MULTISPECIES: MoaD/ThiS family protein [Kitasatospora]|uniref:Thiamine biosynthesis protein ThiS n=1 Tax=Kitasatospora setae (strain ATCC 33774 / DSM 43861 / JCM 3304 / KCC A-0304 / NBRC 14216 / KM-6054) TaxID=452652 RepID=E4N3U5_KITSK|nr:MULTISPECIES: MoaD/ThiS family protein [Kitasatospora]BAJ31576.1 hypothetical protein KSE_58050 [Kitasatospora setae KM-6054]
MIIVCAGSLLRFADYRREIPVDAPTVRAALAHLAREHPALGAVLLDDRGALRRHHRLLRGGDLLTDDGLDLPVADRDRVEILTSISGG